MLVCVSSEFIVEQCLLTLCDILDIALIAEASTWRLAQSRMTAARAQLSTVISLISCDNTDCVNFQVGEFASASTIFPALCAFCS